MPWKNFTLISKKYTSSIGFYINRTENESDDIIAHQRSILNTQKPSEVPVY
jgi:hypothetical protein